jgi:recombinational DNA repair protein (RecF pathway)
LHPRFDQCAKCDASIADEYLFDIASGGILCRSCSGKNHFSEFFKIEPEERLFLERTTQLKLGQVHQLRFSAQKVSYLSRLISQFASFHTQVRLP